MLLDDTYTPRRVRIIGKPDEVSGCSVQVQDAQTGEAIHHVASVTIILDPKELNVAELTYYQTNDAGNVLVGDDGGPMMMKRQIHDVEIDVTAFERMTLAEAVAQCFHETYECLAPQFNYQTRKASAVVWKDVPENNKRLMIAVAEEVLQALNYNGVKEGRSRKELE